MSILITILFWTYFPEVLKKLYFVTPIAIENEGKFQYWTLLTFGLFLYALFYSYMYVIYHLELPFFERYKITNNPWPWNDKSEDWNAKLKKTLIQLAINHFICTPIVSLEPFITNIANYRCDLDSLPSIFEIIWQNVFFMLIEDFLFYWGHRLSHWDKIYPYMHKQHHQYINSISISATYSHWFEFCFFNILPAYSGPLLLGKRTHLLTTMMWSVLRIAETIDGHCGYEFSWSPFRLIPFSGSAEYHHHHHLSYKGNYSSFFTIWDRICGTVNKPYLDYVKEREKDYDHGVYLEIKSDELKKQ